MLGTSRLTLSVETVASPFGCRLRCPSVSVETPGPTGERCKRCEPRLHSYVSLWKLCGNDDLNDSKNCLNAEILIMIHLI